MVGEGVMVKVTGVPVLVGEKVGKGVRGVPVQGGWKSGPLVNAMEVRVALALSLAAEAPVTGIKLRAVSVYIKVPNTQRTQTPNIQTGMVLFFSLFSLGWAFGVFSDRLFSMVFHRDRIGCQALARRARSNRAIISQFAKMKVIKPGF